MANGKRGRARKPTALLKLNGTYRADKHGTGEPAPTGKPTRPASLEGNAHALEYWDYIVPKLEALGLATDCDQQHLELLCVFWSEFAQAYDGGSRDRDSLRELAAGVRLLADVLPGCKSEDVEYLASRTLLSIGDILDRYEKRADQRFNRMQRAAAEYSRLATKFGLTPVDRQGLHGTKAADSSNPFEKFLKSREGLGGKVVS